MGAPSVEDVLASQSTTRLQDIEKQLDLAGVSKAEKAKVLGELGKIQPGDATGVFRLRNKADRELIAERSNEVGLRTLSQETSDILTKLKFRASARGAKAAARLEGQSSLTSLLGKSQR